METDLPIEKLLSMMHQADQAIMEVYADDNPLVEIKSDNSPLTLADTRSHNILTKNLQVLFPDIPIVSEEGDEITNSKLVQEKLFWLIDSLDGTKEFIVKNGEFTVCIALVEYGRPIFGMISAPAIGVTYYGNSASGSYKKIAGQTAQRIYVSDQPRGVVLGSRSSNNQATLDYIGEHFPNDKIQEVGSQLKLTYIAEGRADAYPRLGSTMRLWDLAAGQAILEGAGGQVTRPDGSAIDYCLSSLLVGDFIARASRV